MGDMADVFNEMKAYKKVKREERTTVNAARLQELGITAREQSKNVFRVDTEWGAVMYYPGSNCWQHRGKTQRGDVHKFHAWMKSQGYA
jgi:hypothetical protein